MLEELIVPPDLVEFRTSGRRMVVNPELSSWCTPDEEQYRTLRAVARREPRLDRDRTALERDLGYLLLHYMIYRPGAVPKPQVALPQLKMVYYAITDGCNLRCPYCYASSEKALPGELSTAESMKLVDDAAEMGAPLMIFTGGEPMMRRDLFDVVRHVRARGMRANIITNGTLVRTAETAAQMAELFDVVTVSMDGATREKHEKTRGRGTFDKTVQALRLLNEQGVKPIINHVLSKDSVQSVQEFSEFIRGFDIAFLRCMQQSTLGRGKEDDGTFEWNNYIDMFDFAWTSPASQGVFTEGPKAAKPCSVKGNCGMGGTEIYVNSLGNVYPCKLITGATDIAGNVRTQRLSDIFANPVLAAMRASSPIAGGGSVHADCTKCYIRGGCGGGCRGYHLARSGDYTRNSRTLCRQLRHQQVSAYWASTGLPPKTLVADQGAYIPYLVRTGEVHEVFEDWKAEQVPAFSKQLPLLSVGGKEKGCSV
ncbi:StsB family radical SAM/SPASM domain sactipeptide maturase [Streptacidiphilus albus]|jgi:radical SAM protein with 4Fe4S-binding SPASM domain|uniref:StsB family radical SAM/SPASM domain sactipeptide maturase n=1 Tax=Streptacidiphilus albus TaxID=105425 RepID=UPI00054BA414|nr:StsB family radical SAM/SPASM domain sactipeptide maturase [Streptacidiphilus albus]